MRMSGSGLGILKSVSLEFHRDLTGGLYEGPEVAEDYFILGRLNGMYKYQFYAAEGLSVICKD